MIELNIVVLPARSAEAKADPVFYLAGGPGQAAALIATAGEDSIMRALRAERDLVFVDQRGSGDSNGLQCDFPIDRGQVQNFFVELFELSAIQSCHAKLAGGADLRYYTTPLAVDDLEEVRRALGYQKINLYGVSHGALAALEYLRRYPDALRSAALAGVATLAAQLPLQFAQGAEHAMNHLLADCAADPTCNHAFPNLAEKFAALLRSFAAGPAQIQVVHAVLRAPQSATLPRGSFVLRLLAMLYSHRSARLLPLVIDRASQGDWAPYVQGLLGARTTPEYRVFLGAYLSATCSETVARIAEVEVAAATANTFIGDYRTRRHQQACIHWPHGEIADDFYRPVRATTPVLMLSGDIDPATPVKFAAEALKNLPNGRQVILRNTPHEYGSACVRDLIAAFIAAGSAHELDTSCGARLRRPPFATELPASYNR